MAILSIQSHGSYGYAGNSAAVFLSRYPKSRDTKGAVELSAASIYGITAATFKAHHRELRILEAQNELVNPSLSFDEIRLEAF